MSKKSRKRNKKILGALAAGLGAMALMKGRGAKGNVSKTAAMEDANINTNAPILGTDHITKKVVAPVVADTSDSRFNTRFSKPKEETMSKALRSQILQAKANAPKNVMGPFSYMQPKLHTSVRGVHRAKGGRIGAKHGGSVTGIAKRGFGRALMKGKK